MAPSTTPSSPSYPDPDGLTGSLVEELGGAGTILVNPNTGVTVVFAESGTYGEEHDLGGGRFGFDVLAGELDAEIADYVSQGFTEWEGR
jgi:hypothetical protein